MDSVRGKSNMFEQLNIRFSICLKLGFDYSFPIGECVFTHHAKPLNILKLEEIVYRCGPPSNTMPAMQLSNRVLTKPISSLYVS